MLPLTTDLFVPAWNEMSLIFIDTAFVIAFHLNTNLLYNTFSLLSLHFSVYHFILSKAPNFFPWLLAMRELPSHVMHP